MFVIGPLGFTVPWLLWGLVALPVLWLLLRAVPPAPIRRRFPGVALLLGLEDDEAQTDKTPWWLLLLRMLAIAAVIIGFSGPVLNPKTEQAGTGPLLVLIDGTWADARDWSRRMTRVDDLLTEAGRQGRPVALAVATDLPPQGPEFQTAEAWLARLPGISPRPWSPQEDLSVWVAEAQGGFDTFWMSDGVDRADRQDALAALEDKGQVTVFESGTRVLALRPPRFTDGEVIASVLRDRTSDYFEATVQAIGLDPNGVEQVLERSVATFEDGQAVADATFDLPPELRNRVSRLTIAGQRSAGAVALTDDALKRREIALIAGRDDREGLELLSPLHYLRQALSESADLINGQLLDIIQANPDVIVLADVARVAEAEEEALIDWIERGGLLLRFAGPRLAASDVSRASEDPLMPVRLRAGGRTIGGALSWGEPKQLREFPAGSPFAGLEVPEEVAISAQVMALPSPDLSARTIALLADGTPLVTRKQIEQGQIVLFHVTANAEWSTLPLSGLFVQMLERLAVTTPSERPSAEDLAGTTWVPEQVLDAFGDLSNADSMPGVAGEDLSAGKPSSDMPPGLYAGEERRIAVNVLGPEDTVAATRWPARITVEGLAVAQETLLKGAFLAAALVLLAVDVLAALALSGRLVGVRSGAAVLAALMLFHPEPGQAQQTSDAAAIAATSEVVLAYVVTGDRRVDEVSQAGLAGLSAKLMARTSVEPAPPVAVNLETDELSFFPFLYWPVTAAQPTPSNEVYAKLNRYLRTGGMIMFDTRDADIARFGGDTPEGRRLKELARPLDIPALEPIPKDHVLTRTFYLLQDFPGRHASRDVWVEAAPPDAEQVEGMPFRNLNDGVTPVVIGGNAWADAWAVNDRGLPMFPIGRGFSGERQREVAFRFGINLIMHVLTGNYKSDQVHVPALLDRLGQ